MAIRVASGISPLVLIQTSVVMECVANSSLPSRHHPLCHLHFPSARAILCDSLKGGWDLFLVPSGWVRRIQLSVMERVGISSAFSLSFSPGQFMIISVESLCRLPRFFPSSVFEEGWDGYDCIPLVFGGVENSF